MQHPKASFFRRFIALLMDIIILEMLGTAVIYPVQQKTGWTPEELLAHMGQNWESMQGGLLFFAMISLILLILWGSYFTVFWAMGGQTPGKKLLGVKIIRTDGAPLGFGPSFNRFVGYNLSATVFFLGFLWALWDRDNQTWHDKWAHTFAIKI